LQRAFADHGAVGVGGVDVQVDQGAGWDRAGHALVFKHQILDGAAVKVPGHRLQAQDLVQDGVAFLW
jgi:hypothetical protein